MPRRSGADASSASDDGSDAVRPAKRAKKAKKESSSATSAPSSDKKKKKRTSRGHDDDGDDDDDSERDAGNAPTSKGKAKQGAKKQKASAATMEGDWTLADSSVHVAVTGAEDAQRRRIEDKLRRLGVSRDEDIKKSTTHLLVCSEARTHKVLQSICKRLWLVRDQWLRDAVAKKDEKAAARSRKVRNCAL